MASQTISKSQCVDKKTIDSLLHLFQSCDGKDSQYLKKKGHVEALDVYFVLMNALKVANCSVLPDTIVAVGQFLHNVSWIGCLTEEQCADVILELCKIIEETNEKSICSRALWCFYSQNLSPTILSKHIKSILLVFSKTADENRFASSSVEFESTRAIKTFISTNPQNMLVLSEIWWNDCLVRLIHPAPRVREMALSIIVDYRHILGQNSHVMQIISSEVKTTIAPGMLRLFSENGELYVLKLWQAIVNLCGKIIHQGSSLINSLLVVVEKAFKCSSDDIRIMCFACWRQLITNFAIAPDVIGNVKRLRLILQPLCAKNAKTENTIRAKIDTWWHLLSCLGLNNTSFEMVFEPLIQFCFGLSDPIGSAGFGVSHKSRLDIDALNTSTPSANDVFAANKHFLVEFGMEILGRFFEACSSSSAVKLPHTLKLGPLQHDMLLKSPIFTIHNKLLLQALEIATFTFLPEDDNWSLLPFIWLHVTNHLKSLLDKPDSKPNMHDVISNFYQTVEAVARHVGGDSKIVLIVLEYASSLPASVLMSSSYNLGQNNKQNDTPGFQLLRLLLAKNVVEKFSHNNKFTTLFNRLVTFSALSPVSVLNYFHGAIQIIGKAAPDIQKEDLICKMWLSIVSRLFDFVEENQEVNQGDALEHDFSCMHAVLVFPFQHFFFKLAVKRNVLKKWEALYQVFARCAAVVSGVDANACCVELASKLKAAIPEKMKIEEIEDIIYIIDVLLSSVHWSEIKKSSAKGNENKWPRKKADEKFELASITQFIGSVISSFIRVGSVLDNASKSLCVTVASTLVGYFDIIFEKLKNDNIVHAIAQLSPQLVEIIRLSCNSESIFAIPNVLNKIEDVWEKLSKNVQLNYSGAYDTTLLNTLSPLLEATFGHKKQSIQMDTRLFWQGTFASSYDPHLIPDSLRDVIEKVRPAIGMDNSSLDDKTEMSSSESKTGAAQQPSSAVVASRIASPKVSGSFLNKANKSPSSVKKLFTSPALKSTPKSKGIDEMNAKEFVVIKSPSKGKRRVLTEHQKEVASRRSLIPAMYVDLSQDSCIVPTETQDIEDSQQITMDASNKETNKEVLKQFSIRLNKENCVESTSKNTGMTSSNARHEISESKKVNTCVAEGSDEANIELLNSQQSVVSDESTSKAMENAGVSCNRDSLHDSQETLSSDGKSNSNLAISDFSEDTQTASLQAVNFEEENSLKDANNSSTIFSSSTKSRRTSLRSNSKERVYYYKKKYKPRKKSVTKTDDQLSSDFVEESSEFKVLNAEIQNAGTSATIVTDNVKSKEPDRENYCKNSEDLLNEMAILSLSSVSVICEVIAAKDLPSTASSQSANNKTQSETDDQLTDSVTIISSSSTLENSQSLETSSEELCSPESKKQVPFQRKRKSTKACIEAIAVDSPKDKIRKHDKLTEEEVFLNIRARKRKFKGNLTLDLSPPLTRTRKRQKSLSQSSELPSCLISDAQPLQESLTKTSMENNTESLATENNPSLSLSSKEDSPVNSDIQNEQQSLIPVEIINSNPENNRIESECSTIQHDPSSKSTKASVDSLPDNDVPIKSSAEPLPLLESKTLPVTVVNEPRSSPRKKKSVTLEKGLVLPSQDAQEDVVETSDSSQNSNRSGSDQITHDSMKKTQADGLSPSKNSVMDGDEVLKNTPFSSKSSKGIARNGSDRPTRILMRSSNTLNSLLASPSCSPNGIMKKGGTHSKTSTPTPPNKRKVSFADPLVQGQYCHTPNSGRRSMSRIVNRRLQMTKGHSQDSFSGQNSVDMTQDTYHSPVITELNCHDCICPELVGSKEPIDTLIPHLTTLLHGRGLTKLLSSRNIKTVGDLSSMTEADVHTLPIKAPKLMVVRRTLLTFFEETNTVGNGGLSPICQGNASSVSAVKDVPTTTVSQSSEASPATSVTSTPEKNINIDPSLVKECSPLKSLEDEMMDDSLCENNDDLVLPGSDLQLSASEKCHSVLPCQTNSDSTSPVKVLPKTTVLAESTSELLLTDIPEISLTGTPEKVPGTEDSLAKECSPVKSLAREMAGDSLSESIAADVLPRADLQTSTPEKCESTTMQIHTDAAAAIDSVNDNPFQDIYQFLNAHFDKISPLHLSKVSGSQVKELIAHLGAFSTRVSEAWLDSKCKNDASDS